MRKNVQLMLISVICMMLFLNSGNAQNDRIDVKLLSPPKAIITNQDIFLPGEDIKFRLFGNTQGNKRELEFSLIDQAGNIAISKKLSNSGPVLAGKVQIPFYLKSGKYLVVCYDKLEGVYGSKQIWIERPKDNHVLCDFKFNKNSYENGIGGTTTITFTTENPALVNSNKGKFIIYDGQNAIQKGKFKTDNNGVAIIQFDVPDVKTALIIESEMKIENEKYNFFAQIPTQQQSVKVTFYPEGGNLIDGELNKIVIRSLDNFNNPISVKGNLVDNENNSIQEVVTNKSGHTLINFTPETGKTYSLKLDNNSSSIEFPVAKYQASITSQKITKENLQLKILSNGEFNGRIIAINNNNFIYNENLNITSSQEISVPLNNENGIINLFLLGNEGEIISKRQILLGMILSPSLSLNKMIAGPQDEMTANIIENSDLVGDRNILFNAVQESRLVPEISWKEYNPDYYLNLLLQNQINITDFTNLKQILKVRHTLSAFSQNSISTSKKSGNFGAFLIDLYKAKIKQEESGAKLSRISDSVLGQIAYSDDSKEIPKVKEPEHYQIQLANGVEVHRVLKTIKPYSIVRGKIMFGNAMNSIKIPQGALIYVDGLKVGESVTSLEAINPKDVATIRVITDPTEMLTYTSFNTVGIIDIRLKTGKSEKEETFDSKLNGMYKSNLYWNPMLPIHTKTNSRITFFTTNLEDEIIVFLYDQEQNNLPLFNIQSFTTKSITIH